MWACRNGHTSVVQLFLNHSEQIIELNASIFYGNTAFMDACTSGHKGVVQLLLNHSIRIDLNARDKYGKTAFMKACGHGKTDIVQLLLDHSDPNIELNARSSSGKTVFMMAIDLAFQNAYDEDSDIVKLLLEHYNKCNNVPKKLSTFLNF